MKTPRAETETALRCPICGAFTRVVPTLFFSLAQCVHWPRCPGEVRLPLGVRHVLDFRTEPMP